MDFFFTFAAPGILSFRDVAQPGSALAWGARGRKFESCRPDIKIGKASAIAEVCRFRAKRSEANFTNEKSEERSFSKFSSSLLDRRSDETTKSPKGFANRCGLPLIKIAEGNLVHPLKFSIYISHKIVTNQPVNHETKVPISDIARFRLHNGKIPNHRQ
jgi:hypothetical protein